MGWRGSVEFVICSRLSAVLNRKAPELISYDAVFMNVPGLKVVNQNCDGLLI